LVLLSIQDLQRTIALRQRKSHSGNHAAPFCRPTLKIGSYQIAEQPKSFKLDEKLSRPRRFGGENGAG